MLRMLDNFADWFFTRLLGRLIKPDDNPVWERWMHRPLSYRRRFYVPYFFLALVILLAGAGYVLWRCYQPLPAPGVKFLHPTVLWLGWTTGDQWLRQLFGIYILIRTALALSGLARSGNLQEIAVTPVSSAMVFWGLISPILLELFLFTAVIWCLEFVKFVLSNLFAYHNHWAIDLFDDFAEPVRRSLTNLTLILVTGFIAIRARTISTCLAIPLVVYLAWQGWLTLLFSLGVLTFLMQLVRPFGSGVPGYLLYRLITILLILLPNCVFLTPFLWFWRRENCRLNSVATLDKVEIEADRE